MNTNAAGEGPVERPVRPRAWACVWPEEDGCGGGAFTTMDESSARNYMAGANESADAGRSACRPELVLLYDQAALDAAVALAVAAEVSSRGMFVARLENMQAQGDQWLTVPAVLALLNDCDMLAASEGA